MRRRVFVSLALFACGFLTDTAIARAQPPLTPRIAAAIDRLATSEIQAGRAPAIAIGVVEDGRIVYARGFGKAGIAKNVPAEPDSEFYVGDVTQQFTAAAILMVAQDGKLKLDDKITKYLPELAAVGADVTVAELLTQTSGLPDVTKLAEPPADLTRTIKSSDLLAALNARKPPAAPGSTYADNPTNYLLASIILERASGEPLSDFLQQRIFFPLVMNRTFLAGDTGISPSHAIGYTHAPGGGFVVARSVDPAWLRGDRGLVTTIYDLAKWDIEMPILLRVDAMRTMFAPSAAAGPGKYGMGWVIDQRGGKRFVWYAGQIPGYQAMNALLPDNHVAVIVMTNADALHGGRIASASALAAQILDIIAPPSTARLDNAIVARAQEWLLRLADKHIDRTQLTPSFSAYLTDDLVSRSDFAALGRLQAIVPISSSSEDDGGTLYEFLVRYPRAHYHYKFGLTRDGKINQLALVD